MKFQLTLANVLLLVTAVAVGVSLWLQYDRIAWLENRLPGLRDAARELDIRDPALLHGVEPHPEWYGEKKWEIHVPKEHVFSLRLVTQEIPVGSFNKIKFPDAEESIQLTPGRHMIELRIDRPNEDKGQGSVEVLLDDATEILLEKDSDWFTDSFSSQTDVHECISFPYYDNVVLIQSRNRESGKMYRANARLNGVLLWISSESAN